MNDFSKYKDFNNKGDSNCSMCNGRGIVFKVDNGKKTWYRKCLITSTNDEDKGLTVEEVPCPECRG